MFLMGGEMGGRASDERLNLVFRIKGGKRKNGATGATVGVEGLV